MRRLALLVLVLSGCGRTLVLPHSTYCVFDTDCPSGLHCINQVCGELDIGDAGPPHGHKRFGEWCDAGFECESDSCVGGPSGPFCTQTCADADAGCPFAFDCKLAPARVPGVRPIEALCTVPQHLLCQTCANDVDCGASGADKCLPTDGGDHFCGKDCTFTGCPALYECLSGQCVPQGKTCDCTGQTIGMRKGCRDPNMFGACEGNQVCQSDGGFTGCDAPAATAEICDGVDNDCNGFVDDFTPPTCTKSANGHTCTGPQVCLASKGLVCDAPTPIDEICNYADDDCNGKTDEPFTDPSGHYTLTTHCGGCFRDCKQLITHSVTVSCDPVLADAGDNCHVSKCDTGFYVSDAGKQCLELPDTLCRPCASDADCIGPGSKCLTLDGEKVCGRDCSATSAYSGPCPSGYTCGAGQQCVPTTMSCNCRSSAGAQRSCTVQTCHGFQSCNGMAWSSCDVSSYNPEICDGVDNNCNGQTDEGWKNQTNGRYESPQNCGFCNNDCTKYFSPTLQHTTGVCDLAPTMPACKMGPCLTELDGGTQYEWVDVDKQPVNGCECRRLQGNTLNDPPDRAAPWLDGNCDGIDGVEGDAIFVSKTGTAMGPGTRAFPYATITQGLTALQAQAAKKYVLVAAGLYRESVKLLDGQQLFGGYSGDFLKRDPLVYVTTLVGQTGGRAAIDITGAGKGALETVVAGFQIFGQDVNTIAPDSANGTASVGVLLQDCGAKVVLATNEISGGRGGDGGRGKTGGQGFGKQASNGVNGLGGVDSSFLTSACTIAFNHAGGNGGSNASCMGANGNKGGSAVCPAYDMSTFHGVQQQFPVGPLDGQGGFDWSFDNMSGFQCDHVTESGWPSMIQSHDGLDGQPGSDGTGGPGGTGAGNPARFGSILGGVWVASPTKASVGGAGGTAHGGGGGGSGGGVARWSGGGCNAFEMGASGGGGGAGACGGSGGDAGGAGGSSIAVLITYSAATSTTSLPTLNGNRIARGVGGLGGAGGFGGAGGLGGAGGFGGTAQRWSSSTGGKGGEGGNGGPGGGGGGGAGGPSYGILAFNVAADMLSARNTFVTPSTANPGGQGGQGGSSPGTTGTGTAGVRGATADSLSLTGCPSGCPGGTTCDANSVCVPN